VTYTYIPILRWKRGEKIGLQNLSAAARQDIVPLFLLGTEQFVGRKATQQKPAMTAPVVFVNELQSIWGTQRFYLDASAIPPTSATHHPIEHIATSAQSAGLQLVPATRLGASLVYQAAVQKIVSADGRGVALVVGLNEFTSGAGWINAWPFAPGQTDLILDLRDNARTVNSFGAAIDQSFLGLHAGGQWRTVTLAGSSMPENFTGMAAGLSVISRDELALWQRLSALSLPYRLDYGDYTTVAVTPAPSGIRWGFPINARYTLLNQFLVCRGVNTTGPGAQDMDVQLRGHAASITAYPSRGPLSACWGDAKIDNIGSGVGSPQGLEHWVQIGVNRHIELTRHHLP